MKYRAGCLLGLIGFALVLSPVADLTPLTRLVSGLVANPPIAIGFALLIVAIALTGRADYSDY